MFPNYKKSFWSKSPDRWEDMGEIKPLSLIKDGREIVETVICSNCHTVIHIGKEEGKIFKFCPMCMIKTSNK